MAFNIRFVNSETTTFLFDILWVILNNEMYRYLHILWIALILK